MPVPLFLTDPESLDAETAVLRGPEAHHLHVRRLRPGSPVVLGDGQGRQRAGLVAAAGPAEVVVRFTAPATFGAASACRIVLAQAALKADKLDLVVEKATELGVAAILIYTSARSLGVVSSARRARWERIARSAAKQCRRTTVPEILGPVPADAAFSSPAAPTRLLFLEPGTAEAARASMNLHDLDAGSAVMPIVGPEGGFAPDEVAKALQAGCRPVQLGTHVLRAETAAIVVVTLCQFLWGELVPPTR